MKRFNDDLNFNGAQYCVKLPFREHHQILPDNFQNSKTCLVQLLKKSNPELLANYDKIIKTYEKENIIEKIETVGKPGLEHYLPHHIVIKNENDTTKTHIVFNVSLKIGKNPSLNDCLH